MRYALIWTDHLKTEVELGFPNPTEGYSYSNQRLANARAVLPRRASSRRPSNRAAAIRSRSGVRTPPFCRSVPWWTSPPPGSRRSPPNC